MENLRSSPFPQAADYARVRDAILYIRAHARQQPGLDEIAAHVGLSPTHFHKLFARWAGLSPKAFVQALTLDHAKRLLEDSANVLETSFEVGLSGGGRLHDLFVQYEALSPGEYARRGEGLVMRYGFHDSPFGHALIMTTPRGIAGLAFADDDTSRASTLKDMQGRWPAATFIEDEAATKDAATDIFAPVMSAEASPLRLVLIGTRFDLDVWQRLLDIPPGHAVTYGDIAASLGRPKAHRAVGSAVGRNPISFVVPCHRVLGKGGSLNGYHWSLPRKQAIIGWEKRLVEAPDETSPSNVPLK